MFTSGGINIINELYEQYGDTYYFVGQPTTGDGGNYLTCAGVVVVNQNTTQPEAVAAFLECLLKDEIQYASSMLLSLPVTKVSAEEVKMVEIDGEMRASWRTGTVYQGRRKYYFGGLCSAVGKSGALSRQVRCNRKHCLGRGRCLYRRGQKCCRGGENCGQSGAAVLG